MGDPGGPEHPGGLHAAPAMPVIPEDERYPAGVPFPVVADSPCTIGWRKSAVALIGGTNKASSHHGSSVPPVTTGVGGGAVGGPGAQMSRSARKSDINLQLEN